MDFYTAGFNYYVGYIHYIYVTNKPETLNSQSAKDYYKIIHINSGTSHISINNNEYILTGAHAIYLNERDNITFYDLPENAVTILFFKPSVINSRFNFEVCNYPNGLAVSDMQDIYLIKKFQHDVKTSVKILRLINVDSLIIAKQLKQLNDLLTLQSNDTWPCSSRAYLMQFLFSLIRPEENEETLCPTVIHPNFSKLTIDIIYYLQSYYTQKITINKLSQVFCTNRTTLLADFKKSTGLSINQYITQLRLTIASALLRDTELSLYEICNRTGFSDISYFSKSFKKEIKCTPTEYRHINVNRLDV